MKHNHIVALALLMLGCVHILPQQALAGEITFGDFPIAVMLSDKAKMVTATYTGRQGLITRRMIYDEQGKALMHTALYAGGNWADTTLFDPEGRVMATMDNHGAGRMVSDGSIDDYTKYKDAYSLTSPRGSARVNTDSDSRTDQGEWTRATCIFGDISREIVYDETPEYQAALAEARRLTEELTPEYEKKKEGLSGNRVEGILSLLFLFVIIGGVGAILIRLTRNTRTWLRYAVRHVVGVFAFSTIGLPIVAAAFGGNAWITVAGMIALGAAGVWWIFYGKKHFRRMAEHRELSNTYILLSVIGVSGLLGYMTLPILVSILVPIPVVGTILGLLTPLLLIHYHNATHHRCPQCHASDCYYIYKVTSDGHIVKVEKGRDVTTSAPTLNRPMNRLERETIDRITKTTRVYERELVHQICSECGYYHSYHRRGRLLGQQSETKEKREEEVANLD